MDKDHGNDLISEPEIFRDRNSDLELRLKEKENTLKELEKEILLKNQLLDNVHEAIFACDENEVITYWNKTAEQMTGYSADETVGQPVRTVFNLIVTDVSLKDILNKVTNIYLSQLSLQS